MSLTPQTKPPENPPPRDNRLIIAAVVLAIVVAGVYLLRDRVPGVTPYQVERVVFLIMAAIVVGGGLWARGGGAGFGPDWLRNALLWLAIIVGVTLALTAFGSGLQNYHGWPTG